jgi:hypothetical protein
VRAVQTISANDNGSPVCSKAKTARAGGCGQCGLPSVIKRPLSPPPPPLAWPRGLAADEPPRHHSYRKANGQEPREVVRPDIDRVKMHREGEHHHRVLRARRKGNNHVGDPKRKQRYNDQRKRRGNGDGDRKRAKELSSILGLVFANLAPATAPSVSTAAPPAHQGNETWIKSVP